MKFNYFDPKTVEKQARFLALHLPNGRAWNSQTGKPLFKLLLILASGFFIVAGFIQKIIFEFRIETSVDFLEKWEESFGIVTDETKSLDERRAEVKAQYRKKTVVSAEEWESVLSEALGKEITVKPSIDYVPDEDFLLPNPVPTPLFLPYPDVIPQNRFIVIIDGLNGSSEVATAKGIVARFRPSFVVCVYIDRDYFF